MTSYRNHLHQWHVTHLSNASHLFCFSMKILCVNIFNFSFFIPLCSLSLSISLTSSNAVWKFFPGSKLLKTFALPLKISCLKGIDLWPSMKRKFHFSILMNICAHKRFWSFSFSTCKELFFLDIWKVSKTPNTFECLKYSSTNTSFLVMIHKYFSI